MFARHDDVAWMARNSGVSSEPGIPGLAAQVAVADGLRRILEHRRSQREAGEDRLQGRAVQRDSGSTPLVEQRTQRRPAQAGVLYRGPPRRGRAGRRGGAVCLPQVVVAVQRGIQRRKVAVQLEGHGLVRDVGVTGREVQQDRAALGHGLADLQVCWNPVEHHAVVVPRRGAAVRAQHGAVHLDAELAPTLQPRHQDRQFRGAVKAALRDGLVRQGNRAPAAPQRDAVAQVGHGAGRHDVLHGDGRGGHRRGGGRAEDPTAGQVRTDVAALKAGGRLCSEPLPAGHGSRNPAARYAANRCGFRNTEIHQHQPRILRCSRAVQRRKGESQEAPQR